MTLHCPTPREVKYVLIATYSGTCFRDIVFDIVVVVVVVVAFVVNTTILI